MVDIASLLYAECVNGRKVKRSSAGWTVTNAVCCVYNGEPRPDTRQRAAFRADNGSFVYTCRNCSFKTRWEPGRMLSMKTKNLLSWLGVSSQSIKRINFKVWQLHETVKINSDYKPPEYSKLEFSKKSLPKLANTIEYWATQDSHSKDFLEVLEYAAARGDAILNSGKLYWTPEKGSSQISLNRRLLIPFHWKGEIVGWTARAIFPTRDRYYSDMPPNYIFNTEVVENDWKYLFVNEGPLDALANNGVAMLGDKVSPEQIQWLNHCGKTIVVVPDRVSQGGALVDVAVKEGWHVSFPRWDSGIKDSADAAQKYGKLYTIWSIIDTITNSRLEINVKRQYLK